MKASSQQLRLLGSQIAQFVQKQDATSRSTTALQGVIADLTAFYPDLAAPLRDLSTRQSFHALIPFALSGRGAIQRDALTQEISRVYHPEIVGMVEDVINGFLDTTDGISRSRLAEPAVTATTKSTPRSEGDIELMGRLVDEQAQDFGTRLQSILDRLIYPSAVVAASDLIDREEPEAE